MKAEMIGRERRISEPVCTETYKIVGASKNRKSKVEYDCTFRMSIKITKIYESEWEGLSVAQAYDY